MIIRLSHYYNYTSCIPSEDNNFYYYYYYPASSSSCYFHISYTWYELWMIEALSETMYVHSGDIDRSTLDQLREVSRQHYLEKREEKELILLEKSLRDERVCMYVFMYV